jgi:hypothetical protein
LRGNYAEATLSMAAMIPLIGNGATAAKVVPFVFKYGQRDFVIVKAGDRMQAFYKCCRSTASTCGSRRPPTA